MSHDTDANPTPLGERSERIQRLRQAMSHPKILAADGWYTQEDDQIAPTDREYIAACDPATISELLSELDELWRIAGAYRPQKELADAVNRLNAEQAQRITLQHHAADMAQRVAELEAEVTRITECGRAHIRRAACLESERDTARGALRELERQVFALQQQRDVLQTCLGRHQRDAADPPGYLQDAVIRAAGLGALHEQRDAAIKERDELRARLAEIERQEPVQGPTRLTDEQIEQGRCEVFSVDNPFCPCDAKTMRKAARWAEAAILRANNLWVAEPAQAEPADGCGACGDACKQRGSCRLAEESPQAELTRCQADCDGDCSHPDCPQRRDGEPHATGRSCPLGAEGGAA